MYILASDVVELNFNIFGIFDSKEKLIQAAEKLIQQMSTDKVKHLIQCYGYTGLVYSFVDVDKLEPAEKIKLNYNFDTESVAINA